VYPHADLVTYPSFARASGTPFRGDLFWQTRCRKYVAVYARDIDPLGFQTIEMTQLVTNEVVEQVREILANAQLRRTWAGVNYALGKK
jgi:hypothetical protein